MVHSDKKASKRTKGGAGRCDHGSVCVFERERERERVS